MSTATLWILMLEPEVNVTEPLPVRIGDRTWIGLGVLILKGVEIGDDCTVAAGSIVTKSLPSATLCAGQPARPIRSLNTKKT